MLPNALPPQKKPTASPIQLSVSESVQPTCTQITPLSSASTSTTVQALLGLTLSVNTVLLAVQLNLSPLDSAQALPVSADVLSASSETTKLKPVSLAVVQSTVSTDLLIPSLRPVSMSVPSMNLSMETQLSLATSVVRPLAPTRN